MAESKVTTREGAAQVTLPGDARDAGGLIQGTMAELERALDARNVIGEPMTFGNATVVPLLSVGFGFGAGAGGGGGVSGDDHGQGGGGLGAGGGGMKPIAVLVIEDGKVRLEPVPTSKVPSGLDRLGHAVADVLAKRGSAKGGGED